MRIILRNGTKHVLRTKNGQCYAAVFEASLDDRQIKSRMMQGEAAFFPFNRKTWQFDWSRGTGRPLKIRR